MAKWQDASEYRLARFEGSRRLQTTGKTFNVNYENVARVYTAGIGYDGNNDHNVFTVYLTDGRSFITDWSAVNNFSLLRVNEYDRLVQEDGSLVLQYTNHGMRIKQDHVTCIKPAGIGHGYGTDFENTYDCYRVFLSTGDSFITDSNGRDDILDIGG